MNGGCEDVAVLNDFVEPANLGGVVFEELFFGVSIQVLDDGHEAFVVVFQEGLLLGGKEILGILQLDVWMVKLIEAFHILQQQAQHAL